MQSYPALDEPENAASGPAGLIPISWGTLAMAVNCTDSFTQACNITEASGNIDRGLRAKGSNACTVQQYCAHFCVWKQSKTIFKQLLSSKPQTYSITATRVPFSTGSITLIRTLMTLPLSTAR